jgi:hypothetical protein
MLPGNRYIQVSRLLLDREDNTKHERDQYGLLSPRMILKTVVAFCLSLYLAAGAFWSGWQEEPAKQVRRAKRPVFAADSAREIYFLDFWNEALRGPRPESSSGHPDDDKGPVASSEGENGDRVEKGWSSLIKAEVLEVQVKHVHQNLQKLVTTPSQFNSAIGQVRDQFGILSVWFAIVSEYDGDIRWKKYARTASQSFTEAIAKARTANRVAFDYSKQRLDDLGELIRGGAIAVNDERKGPLDWTQVASRSPIMIRLDDAFQNVLRPAVANADALAANEVEFASAANVVAALGRVLVQKGMDDADDEQYFSIAAAMSETALKIAEPKLQLDAATAAVKAIEQSCNNCHADWR